MAAIATADMPQSQKEELLCTYAALILHDEKMDVTPDNISKLIKAAGASVEPFMPVLFSRALGEINIGDLLSAAGTAGPAPCAGAAPAAGQRGSVAAPVEEEKKVEEEPEEEDDMGFSLFD